MNQIFLKHGGVFDGIKEMLASLEDDNIPYGNSD